MRKYKILDGEKTITQGDFETVKESLKPLGIGKILLTYDKILLIEDYRDAEEIDELMPIINLLYNINYTWEEAND